MNTQEIFNVLDNAFSNFMVADMDHMRCETHLCPEDEAMYYARHDGDRTGRIVAHVCRDKARLLDALEHLPCEGTAVDPVEGCSVRGADMLVYMSCKYQLDEHRRNVCEAFANACLNAMTEVLA